MHFMMSLYFDLWYNIEWRFVYIYTRRISYVKKCKSEAKTALSREDFEGKKQMMNTILQCRKYLMPLQHMA